MNRIGIITKCNSVVSYTGGQAHTNVLKAPGSGKLLRVAEAGVDSETLIPYGIKGTRNTYYKEKNFRDLANCKGICLYLEAKTTSAGPLVLEYVKDNIVEHNHRHVLKYWNALPLDQREVACLRGVALLQWPKEQSSAAYHLLPLWTLVHHAAKVLPLLLQQLGWLPIGDTCELQLSPVVIAYEPLHWAGVDEQDKAVCYCEPKPAGQEVGSLGAMLFPEVRQEYKLQPNHQLVDVRVAVQDPANPNRTRLRPVSLEAAVDHLAHPGSGVLYWRLHNLQQQGTSLNLGGWVQPNGQEDAQSSRPGGSREAQAQQGAELELWAAATEGAPFLVVRPEAAGSRAPAGGGVAELEEHRDDGDKGNGNGGSTSNEDGEVELRWVVGSLGEEQLPTALQCDAGDGVTLGPTAIKTVMGHYTAVVVYSREGLRMGEELLRQLGARLLAVPAGPGREEEGALGPAAAAALQPELPGQPQPEGLADDSNSVGAEVVFAVQRENATPKRARVGPAAGASVPPSRTTLKRKVVGQEDSVDDTHAPKRPCPAGPGGQPNAAEVAAAALVAMNMAVGTSAGSGAGGGQVPGPGQQVSEGLGAGAAAAAGGRQAGLQLGANPLGAASQQPVVGLRGSRGKGSRGRGSRGIQSEPWLQHAQHHYQEQERQQELLLWSSGGGGHTSPPPATGLAATSLDSPAAGPAAHPPHPIAPPPGATSAPAATAAQPALQQVHGNGVWPLGEGGFSMAAFGAANRGVGAVRNAQQKQRGGRSGAAGHGGSGGQQGTAGLARGGERAGWAEAPAAAHAAAAAAAAAAATVVGEDHDGTKKAWQDDWLKAGEQMFRAVTAEAHSKALEAADAEHAKVVEGLQVQLRERDGQLGREKRWAAEREEQLAEAEAREKQLATELAESKAREKQLATELAESQAREKQLATELGESKAREKQLATELGESKARETQAGELAEKAKEMRQQMLQVCHAFE